MTVENLKPGDVIRAVPNEYQIVRVFASHLVVRDLLGREVAMSVDFLEHFMEKVDHA